MKFLPSAQLSIMLIVWAANKPLTRSEIKNKLVDKKWAVTTVNTLLSRLVDSGFLACEHKGREYIYSAIIEEQEYLQLEGKNILNKLYHNSIQNFIAAVCSNHMTDTDVEDLQLFLEQLKRGKKDDD